MRAAGRVADLDFAPGLRDVGAGIGAGIARGETPDLGVIFEPKVLLPLVALGLLSLGTTLYQRRKGKTL